MGPSSWPAVAVDKASPSVSPPVCETAPTYALLSVAAQLKIFVQALAKSPLHSKAARASMLCMYSPMYSPRFNKSQAALKQRPSNTPRMRFPPFKGVGDAVHMYSRWCGGSRKPRKRWASRGRRSSKRQPSNASRMRYPFCRKGYYLSLGALFEGEGVPFVSAPSLKERVYFSLGALFEGEGVAH